MTHRLSIVVVLASGISIASCSSPLGPNQIVSDSVQVVARAAPSVASPGDPIAVIAVYHNTLQRPLSLSFGMGCPFYLSVIHRGTGSIVRLDGTGYSCVAMGRGIMVPATGSVATTVHIVARVGGTPINKGSYAARLDFTNGIWDLDAPFVIE